ncbi:MAG: DUF11 domain-containing protein [Anaerolineae bacterium]|nr:DUF11 domain-containing protein [Anaerolineae bacterium]
MQRKVYGLTFAFGLGSTLLLLVFLLLSPPQPGSARPQALDMGVGTWTQPGYARPGGVALFGIYYGNDGDTMATDVTLVDTLPLSTTYLGDSGDVAPEIGPNGVITWNVGDVGPGEWKVFILTLAVNGDVPTGDGSLPDNCVAYVPGDANPGNDNRCSGPTSVWDDEVEVGVYTWSSPDDPAPGEEFDCILQWCNHRGAAAGPAWMTDTLPLSTTLLSWSSPFPPYWTEISRTGAEIAFYAPGLPGDMCQELTLRLRLDAAAMRNSTLTNAAILHVADDVDLNNNTNVNADTRASGARFDVNLNKHYGGGALVPGGVIEYGIDYWNSGNTPAHIWVTDTLPAGTTYQPGSARDYDNQLLTPTVITAGYVMWDLGELPVNGNGGLNFRVDIGGAVAPGSTLTNCALIDSDDPDYNRYQNTACAAETVNADGPNLRVETSYWWNGDGQLGYGLVFENRGTQALNDVLITDTLPLNTAWDGWWDTGFDRERITSEPQDNHVLTWTLSSLNPGERGQVNFNANLDNPDLRPQWYTNTAEITLPAGEVTPEDNVAEIVVLKGEVERVELWVGVENANIWGEAATGVVVTVTTAHTEVTTMAQAWCGGCWDIGGIGPVEPGDVVTVRAGAGTLPIVLGAPDPFYAYADAETDQIGGRVGGAGGQVLEVNGNWPSGYQLVQMDASGQFTATYGHVPPGSRGRIVYPTVMDGCEVRLYTDIRSYDIVMEVNYGHDWIEGEYESGHTLAITVTDSGGALKGTALLETGAVPWWDDRTGFATNWQGWASGEQPDIAPGDRVSATMDNGKTASVRVGAITGMVDADANTVSGVVNVPWLSGLLNARCSVWEPNAPNHEFTVNATNGAYFCDFTGEWDVSPGQDIAIMYQDPDGAWVINVFHAPAPRLQINTWGEGNAGEGGNFAFHINYRNQGELVAENTVITATLDGATYLTDTAGLPVGGGGNVVSWNLGSVAPGDWVQFDVFVQVTANAGETIANTARIATSNPYDMGGEGEKEVTWSSEVQSNDTHLDVGIGVWTWNPAPGTEYVYNINVCNGGPTASSEVVLTATLPASTSLATWWGQYPGWVEITSTEQLLVVVYPALTGCNQVYARVTLSSEAWEGMELHASAAITAANDMESEDNSTDIVHNVGGAYTNLSLNLDWSRGRLAPGGELRYNLNADNNGSLPVSDTLRITATLPLSTTYLESVVYTPQGPEPYTPTLVTAEYVMWELDGLDNGYNVNFELALDVDPGVTPGTEMTLAAAFGPAAAETYTEDNFSTWTEQIYAPGPNLRVRKNGRWYDWGQDTRRISYQVHVENVGDRPLQNVTVTDVYPQEMVRDGGTSLEWWRVAGWGEDDVAHTITATYTYLNPGENTDINFDVILPGSDPLPLGQGFTNTATVMTPPGDVTPDDNIATAVLFTGPDLFVEKTLVAGEVRAGELLTFSLRFGNAQNTSAGGRWDAPGDSWLTDTLPSELEFVSAIQRDCGPGGAWCENLPQIAGDALEWQIWLLHANEWNELYVTARVSDDVTGMDSFTNSVALTAMNPITEPYMANNADDYAMAVDMPYFTVGKTYASSRVAGMPVTYTLTVTNHGHAIATNVILSDTVPDGLADVSGGTLQMPFIWWQFASIAGGGGTAQAAMLGRLPCTGTVINDDYLVAGSDQGVSSAGGAPVTLDVLAPTLMANFTHGSGVVGSSEAFTGSAATNGPAIAAWAWDFGDDEIATGQYANHIYSDDGDFVVTLTVSDTCGYSATATGTVTIAPPTIVAGFDQSATGAVVSNTIAFSDTSVTDGPDIVAWAWDFGDESAPVTTRNAMHAYTALGDFVVTLTVSDSLGYSATATGTVTIAPPTIVAGIVPTAATIAPGETATFTGTAITDGPPITTWEWDFGEAGATGSGQVVTHTYLSEGIFTVTLEVYDGLGFSNNATATVTVTSEMQEHTVYLPIVMRQTQ